MQTKEISKKGRYLIFFLGDEKYGIAIDHIKEIIAMMKITNVPKTPPFIQGVINLRGLIIPVVDTRMRFAMEHKEANMYTSIIIVEVQKINVGFIVDSVEEVALIDESKLSAPPKFSNSIDMDFISWVAQIENDVVMILDVLKLFEADELVTLEQIEQKHTQGE
ncbi:MAG: purine-binding chemotaxis protein CheW [Campylobacterota bacterium]|nr:purine-binding chemotaxis protein CheW [Campylobacterota bacterium]MDQ1338089.1 purine-binding chemotaxis protein CheW [Campylobacterota bacterium]